MFINLIILSKVSRSSWYHVYVNMLHCLSCIIAILCMHRVSMHSVCVCVCVEYMCMLPRILILSHTCTAMVRLVAWNSFCMIGAILCAQRNKSDTSSGVRSANRATTRLVEMRMSARMLRTSSCQTLISNVQCIYR